MHQAGIILLNFNSESYYNSITESLSKIFKLKCHKIIPSYDLTQIFSTERNQYYSTKIIEFSLIHYSNFDKLLTLTDFDLFVPVLTFVFGEAQLNGKSAVVSTHRLHPEFYGLPLNESLFYSRLIKEIHHELGHTYGLHHCKNFECVMHSSSNVDEIDIKSQNFCKACSSLLNDRINF